MKKMTIRKLLENIVAKSYGQKIKKFYLVSTDGEVVTADFAIDLVQNVAGWNFLWEVEVVSAKRVDDYVTVIYNPDIEQTNGDPDRTSGDAARGGKKVKMCRSSSRPSSSKTERRSRPCTRPGQSPPT